MSFKKAKGNVTAMEIFTTDERKAGLKEKITQMSVLHRTDTF